MAWEDFKFTPEDGLENTTTFPSKPTSGAAARTQFMTILNQIKAFLNGGVKNYVDEHKAESALLSDIDLTLVNGWTVAGSAKILKNMKSCVLRFTGLSGTAATSNVICIIPDEYRPKYDLALDPIVITGSGEVRYRGTYTTVTDLFGAFSYLSK